MTTFLGNPNGNVNKFTPEFMQRAGGVSGTRLGSKSRKLNRHFPVESNDDKVVGSATVGSPLLPLAAFLLFGAKHQPAEIGGKVGVGKVPGRTAGFATAGCAKDAHAGRGVGRPEGSPVSAIPQHHLRVEIRQVVRGIGQGKFCWQGAEFGKAKAKWGRGIP